MVTYDIDKLAAVIDRAAIESRIAHDPQWRVEDFSLYGSQPDLTGLPDEDVAWVKAECQREDQVIRDMAEAALNYILDVQAEAKAKELELVESEID